MANRIRGRRPTPDGRKVKLHEKKIREAQDQRLQLERELEAATDDLARRIDAAINDSVGTQMIGSWIISPAKPDGLSRQMVFKLVQERVDQKSAQPTNGARRKRPGSEGR